MVRFGAKKVEAIPPFLFSTVLKKPDNRANFLDIYQLLTIVIHFNPFTGVSSKSLRKK
jgi:hypothetical protein